MDNLTKMEIAVHEPKERPTVRWVTMQNADDALSALSARLDASERKKVELMETVASAAREVSMHMSQADKYKKELEKKGTGSKEDKRTIERLEVALGEAKNCIDEQNDRMADLRLLETTSSNNRDEFKAAYQAVLVDMRELKEEMKKHPPEPELGEQVGLQQLLHGKLDTYWYKYSGRTIALIGVFFITLGLWWRSGFNPAMPVILGAVLIFAGALNGYDKEKKT